MDYQSQKAIREKRVKQERLSKLYRKRATIVPYQEKAIHILEKKGIHCVREKRILTQKSYYLVDIYLPDYNICIELDGISHNTPEAKEKDRIRDEWMKTNGYWVIRLQNEEVNTGFYQKIKKSIKFRESVIKKYGNTNFQNESQLYKKTPFGAR